MQKGTEQMIALDTRPPRLASNRIVRWLAFVALLFAGAALITTSQLTMQTNTHSSLLAPDLGNLPLAFEPNAGQSDRSVLYTAHAAGGTLAFSASGVTLSVLTSQHTGSANSVRQGNA